MPKTICLNMIVKNESKVIQRCLVSLKDMIDCWVIVDTGSTDGTQTIIRDFLKDIPGELHERPWVNFEHNRNEALVLAKNFPFNPSHSSSSDEVDILKNKSDYFMFIDADEQLVVSEAVNKDALDKDCYDVMVHYGELQFFRMLLINNHPLWHWEGIIHEVPRNPEAKTQRTLPGIFNLSLPDGARSHDPLKCHKDAAVLEQALEKDPDNARHTFYLAQSYLSAKEYPLALKNFEKRITMGDWKEEVFWSLYNIGRLRQLLKVKEETVINLYLKAFEVIPSRAEPLYRIATIHRKSGDFALGYDVASCASSLEKPQGHFMFIESWIYEYGALFELSNCLFGLGKLDEANAVCDQLLANEKLPQKVKKTVINNQLCARSNLYL